MIMAAAQCLKICCR